jgi:hypothetical protein
VQQLIYGVNLPEPAYYANTWSLRLNCNLTIPPSGERFYNTGLRFVLPPGLIGVIASHPDDHGIACLPVLETTHFYDDSLDVGLTVRLRNNSVNASWTMSDGHPFALIHFYRSAIIELREIEREERPVGHWLQRHYRALVPTQPRMPSRYSSDEESEGEAPAIVPPSVGVPHIPAHPDFTRPPPPTGYVVIVGAGPRTPEGTPPRR